jgi:bifunctional non-homologous end joining protein LigD
MRVPGTKIPPSAPCLPTPAQKAPSGLVWVHEVKHDGYRLIARQGWQSGPAIHPPGYNWSGKYPWKAAQIPAE